MKAKTLPSLLRPFTLLAPTVGVVSGALVASAALGVDTPWLRVGAGILAALLATGASNAWNQAFDVELDRINKPSRPIPSGRASVRDGIVVGHVAALLALAVGWFAGPSFFACVTIGVFATWIYSAPPLRTKRHPLGALLTIAIPRGLLVPVAGWATVAEPWGVEPWALGCVAFLFVLGAAATKDFADVEGDVAHGCRTLPALMGARKAAAVIAPFLVFPFLLYPLLGALGWLQPPMEGLWWLGGSLLLVGLGAAFTLLRDPQGLMERGGNHPAWAMMYLLLLGAHIGCAILYQVTLSAV